jgi:hypothetical protein
LATENLAEKLDDELLKEIANDIYEGFEEDVRSRKEWEDTVRECIELSEMKNEEKDYPWPGCSSLKHPGITTAAIQFNANTYPEIVRNDKTVEFQVLGFDETGEKAEAASRCSRHMNFQLLTQDDTWTTQLDTFLSSLPVQGTMWWKIFYDPVKKRNKWELCTFDEIYINHNVKTLEDARRITHKMIKHKSYIISKIREGRYLDIELEQLDTEKHTTLYSPDMEKDESELLEIHTYWDIDNDGYEEPIIVTMLSESRQILRIIKRYKDNGIERKNGKIFFIEPAMSFIDCHYFPSKSGKYHSDGVGSLMLPHIKGINSIQNQLVDAGTLANMQGGFISRSTRVPGGKLYLEPGEWIKLDSANEVDLNKAIMPLTYKEPSSVLLQMYGMFLEQIKEIANITDVMTGKQNAQNVQASTIQTLAEKGLKVFAALQTRVYRCLGKGFKLHAQLNEEYTTDNDYKAILDYPGDYSVKEDYNLATYNICPVANPNLSSDIQRMMRAQQEMMLITEGGPLSGNQQATAFIVKDFLESLNANHIEQKIGPLLEPKQPPPDPELIQLQADMAHEAEKNRQNNEKLEHKKQMDEAKIQLQAEKEAADIELTRAQAMKAMAEAQVLGNEQQFNEAEKQLELLQSHKDAEYKQQEFALKAQDMQAKREQSEHQLVMQKEKMNNDLMSQQMKIQMDHQKHQQGLQHQAQQSELERQHAQQMGQQQFSMGMQEKSLDQSHQTNLQNQKFNQDLHSKKLDQDHDR